MLAASCLAQLVFSDAPPLGSVTSGVSQFCAGMTNLLPPAAMLMVLLGAVVYAAGQMMGAETRARANVWATAALTGALFAMLITSVAPPALGMIYGNKVSCAAVVVGLEIGGSCGGGRTVTFTGSWSETATISKTFIGYRKGGGYIAWDIQNCGATTCTQTFSTCVASSSGYTYTAGRLLSGDASYLYNPQDVGFDVPA